jgi:hypothetical protein
MSGCKRSKHRTDKPSKKPTEPTKPPVSQGAKPTHNKPTATDQATNQAVSKWTNQLVVCTIDSRNPAVGKCSNQQTANQPTESQAQSLGSPLTFEHIPTIPDGNTYLASLAFAICGSFAWLLLEKVGWLFDLLLVGSLLLCFFVGWLLVGLLCTSSPKSSESNS